MLAESFFREMLLRDVSRKFFVAKVFSYTVGRLRQTRGRGGGGGGGRNRQRVSSAVIDHASRCSRIPRWWSVLTAMRG